MPWYVFTTYLFATAGSASIVYLLCKFALNAYEKLRQQHIPVEEALSGDNIVTWIVDGVKYQLYCKDILWEYQNLKVVRGNTNKTKIYFIVSGEFYRSEAEHTIDTRTVKILHSATNIPYETIKNGLSACGLLQQPKTIIC